ncbi:MAG TPA: hypothetical protein VK661_01575 [Planctomycetota bacterium]|nr:hypothetical protein [Planctomycetota bacterium]
MKPRTLLVIFAALAVATTVSCKRHSGGGGSIVAPAPEISYGPKGSSPPVVMTLNIGMTENVTLAAMEAMYAKVITVNQSLWNVTEGQIRIGKVRLRDNTHPGSKSNQYNSLDLSTVDILVWAPADFNGPGISYVIVPGGRNGHFMGLPSNVVNTTFLHELGHFSFVLSWTPGPVLIDEYNTLPDDNACIMELTFSPLRWCWTDNHLTQSSQPHSCWTQILTDYPAFTYQNNNTFPTPPPDPEVEYTDTP